MIDSFWTRLFGDTKPDASSLKNIYPDRWVQFDTLPKSKRFPETSSEYRILFDRHDAIMRHVFEDSRRLRVLITRYSAEFSTRILDKETLALFPDAVHWTSFSNENNASCNYCHVFTAKLSLSNKSLKPLLKLVADELEHNVMLMATDQSVLYHPYPGGADVILMSEMLRDRCKAELSHWLPV